MVEMHGLDEMTMSSVIKKQDLFLRPCFFAHLAAYLSRLCNRKYCIAVVKENAESEKAASQSGLSQNVGQTTFV